MEKGHFHNSPTDPNMDLIEDNTSIIGLEVILIFH